MHSALVGDAPNRECRCAGARVPLRQQYFFEWHRRRQFGRVARGVHEFVQAGENPPSHHRHHPPRQRDAEVGVRLHDRQASPGDHSNVEGLFFGSAARVPEVERAHTRRSEAPVGRAARRDPHHRPLPKRAGPLRWVVLLFQEAARLADPQHVLQPAWGFGVQNVVRGSDWMQSVGVHRPQRQQHSPRGAGCRGPRTHACVFGDAGHALEPLLGGQRLGTRPELSRQLDEWRLPPRHQPLMEPVGQGLWGGDLQATSAGFRGKQHAETR
mmetsp:Transcript_113694/g.321495  ORF Transcript_113694/g.321495 Transcript_113694/m.321495 type:complete len:269 (+) Transcript_113694:536-1342(+)